jgi:hypothetical protein
MPSDPLYGPGDKEEAERLRRKEVDNFEDVQFKILDFLKETLMDMYPDLAMEIEADDLGLLDELQEKWHWPVEEVMGKVKREFRIRQQLDIDWGGVQDLDDLAYEIVQAMK